MSTAQLAAVSYLARYSGHIKPACPPQPQRWFASCRANGLDPLLGIQRAHVELCIWRAGDSGLMDSTVTTMMNAVRGFFGFAHIDGQVEVPPRQSGSR